MQITTLYDQTIKMGKRNLSPELIELYDGELSFPETSWPYVIGNFVQTVDGVVSYKIPLHSGGT